MVKISKFWGVITLVGLLTVVSIVIIRIINNDHRLQRADITNLDTWKAHKGSSYIIYYPPSFNLYEEKSVPNPAYPETYPVAHITNGTLGIFITSGENKRNLQLNNALGKGPYTSYNQDVLKSKEIKHIKINNVDAVMVRNISTGQSANLTDIIAIKDNMIYQINTSLYSDDDFNLLMTLLQTLKFN